MTKLTPKQIEDLAVLVKVGAGELSADAAHAAHGIDLAILRLVASATITPAIAVTLTLRPTIAAPVSSRGTMIKTNQSGGLCVQAPQLVAFSATKNKQYRYTLNMPMDAAKVLFSDESLLAEIAQFVKAA